MGCRADFPPQRDVRSYLRLDQRNIDYRGASARSKLYMHAQRRGEEPLVPFRRVPQPCTSAAGPKVYVAFDLSFRYHCLRHNNAGITSPFGATFRPSCEIRDPVYHIYLTKQAAEGSSLRRALIFR